MVLVGKFRMKITENLTELVVELGELETFERAGMVINGEGVSVKELLELFSETSNVRSKEVVREIFDEVGYGWFVELDESDIRSATDLKQVQGKESNRVVGQVIVKEFSEGSELMSEAEFMDLTPPNAYLQ